MASQEVINIDPKGDIIVEVSRPDGKTCVLVSSKVLALASPVFERMFNSSFKEGLINHKMPQQRLVPLPEDDAEAFILLCRVLHHRSHEIPRSLTGNCLEKLAIICDKYNCISPIAFAGEVWLRAGIKSATAEDLSKLLFAAYILDLPDMFSRISWEILLIQTGPIIDLPGVTDHPLIKGNLLGTLCEL